VTTEAVIEGILRREREAFEAAGTDMEMVPAHFLFVYEDEAARWDFFATPFDSPGAKRVVFEIMRAQAREKKPAMVVFATEVWSSAQRAQEPRIAPDMEEFLMVTFERRGSLSTFYRAKIGDGRRLGPWETGQIAGGDMTGFLAPDPNMPSAQA
jgi:hypothetical protein